MKETYLLLGSNEGDKEQNIARAITLIEGKCGAVIKKSSVYKTEAWGIKEQDAFLNLAININTTLTSEGLLFALKSIEKQVGRVDTIKWGPRIIDIDILFYGSDIIDLPELKVPHPFIAERRFTLEPLNEIAPNFVHPVLKQTIRALLQNCPDNSFVQKV